jgi:hypothetical protein
MLLVMTLSIQLVVLVSITNYLALVVVADPMKNKAKIAKAVVLPPFSSERYSGGEGGPVPSRDTRRKSIDLNADHSDQHHLYDSSQERHFFDPHALHREDDPYSRATIIAEDQQLSLKLGSSSSSNKVQDDEVPAVGAQLNRRRKSSSRRRLINLGGTWSSYNVDMKSLLLRLLHLHTGLLKRSLGKKCNLKFDKAMELAVLSQDREAIKDVRIRLYSSPVRMNYKSFLEQTWMNDMSMEDSQVVVRKIAEASGKDAEHVRYFFLQTQLEEATAKSILNASEDQLGPFVMEMGLDRPSTKLVKNRKGNDVDGKNIQTWPWMNAMYATQKRFAIEKMMTITGREKEWCYGLLRQPQTERGFGLYILTAKDDVLKSKLEDLANDVRKANAAHTV